MEICKICKTEQKKYYMNGHQKTQKCGIICTRYILDIHFALPDIEPKFIEDNYNYIRINKIREVFTNNGEFDKLATFDIIFNYESDKCYLKLKSLGYLKTFDTLYNKCDDQLKKFILDEVMLGIRKFNLGRSSLGAIFECDSESFLFGLECGFNFEHMFSTEKFHKYSYLILSSTLRKIYSFENIDNMYISVDEKNIQ